MSANDTIELLGQLGIKNETVRSFLLGRRRSLSPKTQYHYALDLEFIQSNMNVPLEKAGVADIEALVVLFEGLGHRPSTIKRRMAAMSSCYDYHLKHGSISCNPVKLADLPKRTTARQPYLTYAEFKKLMSHQRTTFKTYQKTHADIEAIQFRSILAVCGLAGLRLEEMLNVRMEDVRIKDVRIPYVRIQGKGGYVREIALHHFALQTLKDWLRIHPKKTGFCYINLRSQEPLSPRTIQRKVKQLVEEAGICKEITPHGLRRTFATLLTEKAGATEFDVKGMLGHAPRTYTDPYVGCSLERQKELLNKIKFGDEGRESDAP